MCGKKGVVWQFSFGHAFDGLGLRTLCRRRSKEIHLRAGAHASQAESSSF